MRRLFCTIKDSAVTAPTSYQLFRTNCRKHKFKIGFLGLLVTSPISYHIGSHYWNRSKNILALEAQKSLQKEKDITKILESFLIQTIMDVLKSPEIMNNGVGFTLELISDPKLNKALLEFLVNGLKDPIFLEEVRKLGTNLFIDIMKDSEVQRDLIKLLAVSF